MSTILVRTILEKEGCVEDVTSGREALYLLNTSEVDLILMMQNQRKRSRQRQASSHCFHWRVDQLIEMKSA